MAPSERGHLINGNTLGLVATHKTNVTIKGLYNVEMISNGVAIGEV